MKAACSIRCKGGGYSGGGGGGGGGGGSIRAGFVLGCDRAVDRGAAVPVDVSFTSIVIELTSQARGDGGGSGSGGERR